MATIIKRQTKASVTYQAKIRLKGFPPQSAVFKRLTDAKLWASNTESEIREGRYFKTVESRKRTVAELIDRYIRDVLPTKKDTIAPARQLAWWRNHLGHLVLADVTECKPSSVLADFGRRRENLPYCVQNEEAFLYVV